MAAPHQLSRRDTRRIAVAAQRLTADRPTELLPLIRHLTFVQYDITKVVAPSADLVAWSRLGSSYSPEEMREALDEQRLLELDAQIRPAEDLRLYRRIATMDREAPIPELPDVTPTWGRASELAKEWGLEALSKRLADLAKA